MNLISPAEFEAEQEKIRRKVQMIWCNHETRADITKKILKHAFPSAHAEQQRLHMITTLKLYEIKIPVEELNALIEEKRAEILSHFPTAMALYITSYGAESFRTLSATGFGILQKGLLEHGLGLSDYAEVASKNLSACIHVVFENRTIQFDKHTGPPEFVKLFREDQQAFENMMLESDPIFKRYKQDAEKRGIWAALNETLHGVT